MSACRYYDRFAIVARDQRVVSGNRAVSNNGRFPVRRGKIKCATKPVTEDNKFRSLSAPSYGSASAKRKPVIVIPETRTKPVVQKFY